MALYRYHITPLSAFATPMRSDTLYGHLLWAAAMLHGEQKVSALIASFAGNEPPFLLSSALPGGCLPLPPLPGIPRQRFKEKFAQQGELLEKLTSFKTFRKQSFWSIAQWQKLNGKLSQEMLFAEWLSADRKEPVKEEMTVQQPHVTIDRQSGSVLDKGGLFFSSSTWYRPGVVLDLYVETREIALFEELFKHLAATGFGGNRTTGKGHFSFKRDDDFDAAPFSVASSHRLSLSVCAAAELSGFAGYWSPFVKHGRAWSGFGEKNPFKKPFFAFAEGSLFSQMPPGGYLLRNIHSNTSLVQIGWPLTIPVTLEGHHAD